MICMEERRAIPDSSEPKRLWLLEDGVDSGGLPEYVVIMKPPYWHETRSVESRHFTCGYCGNKVASDKGWNCTCDDGTGQSQQFGTIYICHLCSRPTYIDSSGRQTPGIVFGDMPSNLSSNIDMLYEEARQCMSANATTAASMCCRKLLMNVAVEMGAEKKKTYEFYVQYLADNHYIPPGAVDWVDQIRDIGNEANHEIRIVERENAENAMKFMEMLLRLVFEYPALAKKRTGN